MVEHDDHLDYLDADAHVLPGGRTAGLLPWLGGARGDALRWCPGERSLFGGLGLGVLLTATFGGASATLAIGYMLRLPAGAAWPAGMLWGLVIGNIDRLLLLVTTGRKRLLAMIPRLAISVFLGFLIAEPLTLRIFQPEITAQLAADQQHQQAEQFRAITAAYQPKIDSDYQRISALENHLAAVKAQQNRMLRLAACESQQANCSTTHRLGCGPYCHYYQRQAAVLGRQYSMDAPRIRSQVAARQANALTLTADEASAEQRLHAAIAASDGWLARKKALDQLQRADTGVRDTVWLTRLAFVLVDLAPLVIKFLLVIFGKSVYEDIADAAAGRERVAAHRLAEAARVDRRKWTRRADAADEIDEAVIDSWKEHKIAEAYGDDLAAGPATVRTADASEWPPSPRLRTVNLAEFAEGSRVHERLPVPISAPLTRLAWIGTSLLAALAIAIAVAHHLHDPVDGSWIALTALPAAALAAYSHGFRRAPAWAHRAAFGTGLVGLALPAVIVALNL